MRLRWLIAKVFWVFCPYKHVREKPVYQGSRLLIGAPHTSNIDFILMLAIAWEQGMQIKWLGKKEMFNRFSRGLLVRMGGIPVDRDNAVGLVRQIIKMSREMENFTLVITPEGSRKGNGWKSGFYHIARGAKLPVSLGYVDKPTRVTGIGPTIEITGDVAKDMAVIRDFYKDKHGVKPAQRTEPRLREETR